MNALFMGGHVSGEQQGAKDGALWNTPEINNSFQ